MHVYSAQVAYRGPDRLDVTRKSAGPDGIAFAPTWKLLDTALTERERAKTLSTQAYALTAGRLGREPSVDEDARRLALFAEAERVEHDAWAAYVPAYLAEMRVSAGMTPSSARWGEAEQAAWDRGCRPQHDAWERLLARPRVVLVCYCAVRHDAPVEAQHCHRVLLRSRILPAYGAIDCGEMAPAERSAA